MALLGASASRCRLRRPDAVRASPRLASTVAAAERKLFVGASVHARPRLEEGPARARKQEGGQLSLPALVATMRQSSHQVDVDGTWYRYIQSRY